MTPIVKCFHFAINKRKWHIKLPTYFCLFSLCILVPPLDSSTSLRCALHISICFAWTSSVHFVYFVFFIASGGVRFVRSVGRSVESPVQSQSRHTVHTHTTGLVTSCSARPLLLFHKIVPQGAHRTRASTKENGTSSLCARPRRLCSMHVRTAEWQHCSQDQQRRRTRREKSCE